MNQKAKTVQKSKSIKTIRNVLVQPFKTVWPIVDTEDAVSSIKMLNELPSTQIVHGTNPVSHLLDQGQACALFITSDFHPQILGKQIIQMARRNNPHILILAPETLHWGEKQEKMIAVRKTYEKQPEVVELLQFMTRIIKAKNYDKEHGNTLHIGKENQKENKKAETAPLELAKLHLTRPAENKRAFIPQISTYLTMQTVGSPKGDWGEYIALNKRARSETENDGSSMMKKSKQSARKADKSSAAYISLTVNRIQGNPNRKTDKKRKG